MENDEFSDVLEGQMNIFDFLKEDTEEKPKEVSQTNEISQSKKVSIKIEKKKCEDFTCRFAGHRCNKRQLWEVADTLDVNCPHVCCRNCDIELCGARCNGSTEVIGEKGCFKCKWYHKTKGANPFYMCAAPSPYGYGLGCNDEHIAFEEK